MKYNKARLNGSATHGSGRRRVVGAVLERRVEAPRAAWPWASLSSRPDIHLNALNNSCGRVYTLARSVEMGT
jgi:hypothetical protein